MLSLANTIIQTVCPVINFTVKKCVPPLTPLPLPSRSLLQTYRCQNYNFTHSQLIQFKNQAGSTPSTLKLFLTGEHLSRTKFNANKKALQSKNSV